MNETHYFVTANSSAGFVNLIDSNINDLEKIYLLTGNNNKAKHDILTEIASKHKNNGNNLEFIHSSYEPDELDGVILRDIKEGYINDRIFPTINADMYEKITFINAGNQDVSQEYVSSYEELYSKAYSSFTNAMKVHDEWEKIYISNMDFEKADKYTENIIDTILIPSNNENPNNIATVRHRFFGCATYKGSVDFIPELTSSLNKRYFIKGRPGTGKSTMLKKIQAKAIELGFDVDSIGIIYWIDAIKYSKENPLEWKMGIVYEYIAEKHNSTSARVERAMRHSIIPAIENIQKKYGYYNKVRNSTFLNLIKFKLI